MHDFIEFQAELRPMLEAIMVTLEKLIANEFGQLTSDQEDFLQDAHHSMTRMFVVIDDPITYLTQKSDRFGHKIELERSLVAYDLISPLNSVWGCTGLLQIIHEKGEALITQQQQIAVEEIIEQCRQILTYLRAISNEYWQKRGE